MLAVGKPVAVEGVCLPCGYHARKHTWSDPIERPWNAMKKEREMPSQPLGLPAIHSWGPRHLEVKSQVCLNHRFKSKVRAVSLSHWLVEWFIPQQYITGRKCIPLSSELFTTNTCFFFQFENKREKWKRKLKKKVFLKRERTSPVLISFDQPFQQPSLNASFNLDCHRLVGSLFWRKPPFDASCHLIENRSCSKQLQTQGKALQRFRDKSSVSFRMDKPFCMCPHPLQFCHTVMVNWLASNLAKNKAATALESNPEPSWCDFGEGQPSLLRMWPLGSWIRRDLRESFFLQAGGGEGVHVTSWLLPS